ncbi:MAG: PucR family transcriptional regulator [Lachnospiraceae bacterium]|nr:PucR family transcriptional regulator [Lachnospiraceae bacterium]
MRRLLWEEASGSGIYGETLSTYLKNDCSLQKTADELHIHRNTLSYRLERLKERYQIDLENPEKKRRYYLSLLMERI